MKRAASSIASVSFSRTSSWVWGAAMVLNSSASAVTRLSAACSRSSRLRMPVS